MVREDLLLCFELFLLEESLGDNSELIDIKPAHLLDLMLDYVRVHCTYWRWPRTILTMKMLVRLIRSLKE